MGKNHGQQVPTEVELLHPAITDSLDDGCQFSNNAKASVAEMTMKSHTAQFYHVTGVCSRSNRRRRIFHSDRDEF